MSFRKFISAVICLTVLLLFSSFRNATADWVNFSGAQSAANIAEIYVEEDHVRLVLEIYINDLAQFIDILPDDFLKQADVSIPPLSERMNQFSKETFQIIADEKTHLIADLKLVEPRIRIDRPNPYAGKISPYTRRIIPGPPEDKRVLYAELIYPFKDKPESLIFVAPEDEQGRQSVSIGFIVYHKGVPVVDFRYMPGSAVLHLDWEDPWYSKFETKALTRWLLSGVKTFLYIEPYEVRHETMVRVRDIESWIDLDLRGDEFIEADENESVKKKIGEFLLEHSHVLIDGKEYRPILDRTSFVKYTMTRTYFLNQPERLPLNTAMIGVIVTYVTKGIPQEVTVDWDLFNDRIQKVPTNAVDPAGPFPSYITPDDNILKWTNYLKTYQMPTVAAIKVDAALTNVDVPTASILCLVLLFPLGLLTVRRIKNGKSLIPTVLLSVVLITGSVFLYPYLNIAVARPAIMTPKLEQKAAIDVLNSLLKNIYRSFDFREEADVYDRLATSVNGDLLTDIYLQNRKSLVVTQAGGAQARIKQIDILDVTVEHIDNRPLALMFHSKWTAMGTVGHWGHIHTRKNQYNANITVEPVDGIWKITGLELLEEKRIDSYAATKTSDNM
jgi:hypothetical protein